MDPRLLVAIVAIAAMGAVAGLIAVGHATQETLAVILGFAASTSGSLLAWHGTAKDTSQKLADVQTTLSETKGLMELVGHASIAEAARRALNGGNGNAHAQED